MDGKINARGNWAKATNGLGDRWVGLATLIGQFGQGTFTGLLNAFGNFGVGCSTRFILQRADPEDCAENDILPTIGHDRNSSRNGVV